MSFFTRIRTKLALALAVPILATAVLCGLQVRQAVERRNDVRHEADLAVTAVGPGSMITTLYEEQVDSATRISGVRQYMAGIPETLAETRRRTDDARALLRRQVEEDPNSAPFAAALELMDERLPVLRASVDRMNTGEMTADGINAAMPTFEKYKDLLVALARASEKVLDQVGSPELRGPARALWAAIEFVTTSGRMTASVITSFVDTLEPPTDPKKQIESAYVVGDYDDDLARLATYQDAPGRIGPGVKAVLENEDRILERQMVEDKIDGKPLEIAKLLELDVKVRTGAVDPLREAAVGEVNRAADLLRADADAEARRFILIAALVALLSVAAAVLAARTVARPLRKLTEEANDLAQERLPRAVASVLNTPLGDDVEVPRVEPVQAGGRDEVGEVAAALNHVQRSALGLAVEQAILRHHLADTHVNLGRRTKNLIDRQLDLITELEQNETDPDVLANLFQLDHLATRARRNAESLMVLADGSESPVITEPVPVLNLLRSCMGEVEGYQRVQVRLIDQTYVSGAAASDLVHLLAELLENSLSYSGDHPVEVLGRQVPSGYAITIEDRGPGMSPGDLRRANERLAGQGDVAVAPSRSLGHYVAGHLAVRHGMHVALAESPLGGVITRVLVPGTLLVAHVAHADDHELSETHRNTVPGAVVGGVPGAPRG